jgi:hypothetical protein
MKFQETRWSCGPASLRNAFRALGLVLPAEKPIARLCGTTKDGTGMLDMAGGVVLMGYDIGECAEKSDVEYYLKQGCPVMLVCYDDSHWVTIVGMLGKDRWVVVDPDPDRWNTSENGTWVLEPKALRSDYAGIAILGKHKRVAKAKQHAHRAKPKRPSR